MYVLPTYDPVSLVAVHGVDVAVEDPQEAREVAHGRVLCERHGVPVEGIKHICRQLAASQRSATK
jgi:hypothetical protein